MNGYKISINRTFRYKEHKATLLSRRTFLWFTWWKVENSITGKYGTIANTIHHWMTQYGLTDADVHDEDNEEFEV